MIRSCACDKIPSGIKNNIKPYILISKHLNSFSADAQLIFFKSRGLMILIQSNFLIVIMLR